QASGQVVASRRDPRQDQPAGPLVPFQDLVGDAGDGATDLAAVEQPAALDEPAHAERPEETETPRGRRGASLGIKLSRLLPGLSGPDLKGKPFTQEDSGPGRPVNGGPDGCRLVVPRRTSRPMGEALPSVGVQSGAPGIHWVSSNWRGRYGWSWFARVADH